MPKTIPGTTQQVKSNSYINEGVLGNAQKN